MLSPKTGKRGDFWKALATYTGTIIGVGIFGLPYVAMKAGFFVVIIYFVLLSFLAIAINDLFGELCCDTHKLARVPGYAEEYIGPKAKKFSFVISSLVLIGALLAYLIVGGDFLYLFAKNYIGGTPTLYVLLFFLIGTIFIFRGIKGIAQFEFVMLIIFLVILLFFLFKAVPFIDLKNLATFNPIYLTFPYGIILFSLWGMPLVPEVKEMVGRDRRKLRKVIVWGVIISAICYLVFIFAFLGATGQNVSKNAISGFASLVGPKVILVGYLFGLITTFTSFITLGLTLRKMFSYDLKIPDKFSLLLACFIPLGLYFIGFKNFLDVIGLTGSILLGIESTLVIFIYKNFIKKRFQRQAPWWIYLLLFFLLVGVIFEVIYFFVR